MSHKEMQSVVEKNQVSMSSYVSRVAQQHSFKFFLKCMALLKAQKNNEIIPTAEEDRKRWLSQNIEQMKNDLHSMSFDDDKLWVTILHSYAMLSQGKVSRWLLLMSKRYADLTDI